MRTTIRTVSFYDRFTCSGASCPQSCCGGWRIPVDEASVRRYRKERSLLGLRTRLALSHSAPRFFNRWALRCPLHDWDGLCALQKGRGEKFLPEVCRIYPREWANLGAFVERTLDLSCVRAAELFIEAADDGDRGLSFREEAGLWELPRAGDNDDPAFLAELDRMRAEALARLLSPGVGTAEDLDDLIFSLADEAKRMQNRLLRTDEGGMYRIRLFPFSIMLLNELMSTCFYEEHLRWTSPVLYRACRRYYRTFDRLTEIEGQRKLDELLPRLFAEAVPPVAYVRYFAYCLLRSWFDSYEDYSFVRRIVEAAIHTNMVLLFEALALNAGETLTEPARASLIAAYEKRAWHNSDTLDAMVKQVNARFVGQKSTVDARK